MSRIIYYYVSLILMVLSFGIPSNGMEIIKVYSEKRTLHTAVRMRNIIVVKKLLACGAPIDNPDEYGRQPLHVAADSGQLEVVKLLLACGAPIDNPDEYGKQPLHYAAESGHPEVVKLLLSRGAAINAPNNDGYQPLHHAADSSHLEVIKLLLARGAPIDASDNRGLQPLHFAALNGQLKVVKLLLARGAPIDNPNEYGKQPLHCATWKGHLEVAKELLVHGAPIDDLDKRGRKPIDIASFRGHTFMIKYLLEHGADFDTSEEWWDDLLCDLAACSPVHSLTRRISTYELEMTIPLLFRMAAGQNQTSIIQAILNEHMDRLEHDDVMRALVGAATAGHARIIATLINHGSNLTETLSHALTQAAAHGRLEVLDYLLAQNIHYNEAVFTTIKNMVERRLASDTPDESLARERNVAYRRILRALAERHRWNIYIQPSINRSQVIRTEEGAPRIAPLHISKIPREIWQHIVQVATTHHLHDKA